MEGVGVGMGRIHYGKEQLSLDVTDSPTKSPVLTLHYEINEMN